ncbi:sulfate transporter/antisigma-factor antagonist STAS [Oceanobacillus picturae]|uniref:Sulfate transporter/antisigma-factor antagonist STAS n=1 Tax=Oceanobacillus picturae TaxID=171693 RepID=A0A0U9HC03_9BACI|nr:hypothetical protein [Oceanobacillus picturae]GAQ17636.1 sulfate transporter/antisigma-factor antagonist STAS [Oceanobacillus picturae]
MTLTQFIYIATGFVSAFMAVFIILAFVNGKWKERPHRLSWAAFVTLLLHWVMVLTQVYDLFSFDVGNFLFDLLWLSSAILCLVAAWKESKNNQAVAWFLAGISVISLLFGFILVGISGME